ncbi:MAG: hypothetical protein ACYC3N_09440 [Halothiobacillus sp.]
MSSIPFKPGPRAGDFLAGGRALFAGVLEEVLFVCATGTIHAVKLNEIEIFYRYAAV